MEFNNNVAHILSSVVERRKSKSYLKLIVRRWKMALPLCRWQLIRIRTADSMFNRTEAFARGIVKYSNFDTNCLQACQIPRHSRRDAKCLWLAWGREPQQTNTNFFVQTLEFAGRFRPNCRSGSSVSFRTVSREPSNDSGRPDSRA